MRFPAAKRFITAGHDVWALRFQRTEMAPLRGGDREKNITAKGHIWDTSFINNAQGVNKELLLKSFTL